MYNKPTARSAGKTSKKKELLVMHLKRVSLQVAAAFSFLLMAQGSASAALEAGGVSFEVPAAWEQTRPSSSMRAFEFRAKPLAEYEAAEMAVFYFGAGMGGAIDANIERWKGQFSPEPNSAPADVTRQQINGLSVTRVALEGTYDGGMGPGGTQTNYAALAAIVEGGQGPVFFKMTGPRQVIEQIEPEFDALLRSFQLS